jgi:hypothetical protein
MHIRRAPVILSIPTVLCLCVQTQAQSLTALSEDDMSRVTGGEGIAMTLELGINASISGNDVTPIACPAQTADCRLALQFNDRSGIWAVIKDYYGLIRLKKVWIDAAVTPGSPSAYAGNPYLISGGSPVTALDSPVVQLSYDHSSLTNPLTSFYDDASLYLNMGRVTAEFDSPMPPATLTTPGYLANTVPGSVIGIRVADGPNGVNGAAQMRFDGKMQMYGF